MNTTPLPDDPPLAAALRACAAGFYPAEAAAELLIAHASWLCREDFRSGYVETGTSITDGITAMAAIDWPAAIAALDGGGLPSSGGERRILRLAASLADGIPIDLRDTFTGMDTDNVDRAVRAMLHASGCPHGRGRASRNARNTAHSE